MDMVLLMQKAANDSERSIWIVPNDIVPGAWNCHQVRVCKPGKVLGLQRPKPFVALSRQEQDRALKRRSL